MRSAYTRSPIFVLERSRTPELLSTSSWRKCAQGPTTGNNQNSDPLDQWHRHYSPTVLEYIAHRRFPDPDIWTHLQLFWERLPPEHRWIVGLGLGASVLGLLGGGNLLPGGLGGILGLGGLLAALGFSFLPENSPGRAMLAGRWADIVREHQMANFIQQRGGSPALVQYYRRHGRFPVPYFMRLELSEYQNALRPGHWLPDRGSVANGRLTPDRLQGHWSSTFQTPVTMGNNQLISFNHVLYNALVQVGLVPSRGYPHPRPALSARGWAPIGAHVTDPLIQNLAITLTNLQDLSPQHQEPLHQVLRYLPPNVVRGILLNHPDYFRNALQNGNIHPDIENTLQQHQQLMDEATRLAEGIFRATPQNTSNPPRTP
jgi:hypothetical protein